VIDPRLLRSPAAELSLVVAADPSLGRKAGRPTLEDFGPVPKANAATLRTAVSRHSLSV
jgi:hypothetical protein